MDFVLYFSLNQLTNEYRFLNSSISKIGFSKRSLRRRFPKEVLQLLITIVFFDSLWIKTNKGMTRALVNEINTFIEVYDQEKLNKDELKNLFSLFLRVFDSCLFNHLIIFFLLIIIISFIEKFY